IPDAFQLRRPVGKEMDLVEEHDRQTLPGGDRLGRAPEPLPESREGRLGRIGRCVERPFTELLLELEEERRLSDLARTGEEHDAPGRRLGESSLEKRPALRIAEPDGAIDHDRIIIRVRLKGKSEATRRWLGVWLAALASRSSGSGLCGARRRGR